MKTEDGGWKDSVRGTLGIEGRGKRKELKGIFVCLLALLILATATGKMRTERTMQMLMRITLSLTHNDWRIRRLGVKRFNPRPLFKVSE